MIGPKYFDQNWLFEIEDISSPDELLDTSRYLDDSIKFITLVVEYTPNSTPQEIVLGFVIFKSPTCRFQGELLIHGSKFEILKGSVQHAIEFIRNVGLGHPDYPHRHYESGIQPHLVPRVCGALEMWEHPNRTLAQSFQDRQIAIFFRSASAKAAKVGKLVIAVISEMIRDHKHFTMVLEYRALVRDIQDDDVVDPELFYPEEVIKELEEPKKN